MTEIKKTAASARLLNCLMAMDIKYLEDVTQYSAKDLCQFRNFGNKSVTELRGLLKDHNLKLKE